MEAAGIILNLRISCLRKLKATGSFWHLLNCSKKNDTPIQLNSSGLIHILYKNLKKFQNLFKTLTLPNSPGCLTPEHKAAHEKLLETAGTLTVPLNADHQTFLKNWLVTHIKGTDIPCYKGKC